MAAEQLLVRFRLLQCRFEFGNGVDHGSNSSMLMVGNEPSERAPLFLAARRRARAGLSGGQEYGGSLGSLMRETKQQAGRHVPRMRRMKKRDPMAFSDDLRRYGPGTKNRLSREASLAYCARLTAVHYENFSVVTWLTPHEHRPAFRSIYAFCRWSDDLGDEVGDRQRSRELLSWWRDELRAMYRGQRSHPVMIALGETVERYSIPIEPFERLISAFEQDQEVTEYETFEQLLDYCQRSANPVGHLVLHVAGAFNRENACLADSICTGLQLANFWQDVARDLAIGRIYLPREDRNRFGCSEDALRAGVCTPGIRQLMEFEVERRGGSLARGARSFTGCRARWRSTSTFSCAGVWPFLMRSSREASTCWRARRVYRARRSCG